jgi:hypothetical protein
MEKTINTSYRQSADASSIYRESASADYATMKSAAVPGNLADAMRNAVLLTGIAEPQQAEEEPVPC